MQVVVSIHMAVGAKRLWRWDLGYWDIPMPHRRELGEKLLSLSLLQYLRPDGLNMLLAILFYCLMQQWCSILGGNMVREGCGTFPYGKDGFWQNCGWFLFRADVVISAHVRDWSNGSNCWTETC